MKRVGHATKTGFTIIEVTLYLALTGLIFVGIIAATRGNLARQRYVGSVNGVVNFLRSAYEELERPSIDSGRTACRFLLDEDGSIHTPLSNHLQVSNNPNEGLACIEYGVMITFTKADDATYIQSVPIVGPDVNDDKLLNSKVIVGGATYENLEAFREQLERSGFLPMQILAGYSGINNIVWDVSEGDDNKKGNLSATPKEYIVENQASLGMVIGYKDSSGNGIFEYSLNGEKSKIAKTGFALLIMKDPLSGKISYDSIITDNTDFRLSNYDSTTGNEYGKYGLQKLISGATPARKTIGLEQNKGIILSGLNALYEGSVTFTPYLCIYPGNGSETSTVRAIRIEKDVQSSSAINLLNVEESKRLGVCDES